MVVQDGPGIPVEIIPDDTRVPIPDDTGLRKELAEARAMAHHLTMQLEEVRQDRYRWHENGREVVSTQAQHHRADRQRVQRRQG